MFSASNFPLSCLAVPYTCPTTSNEMTILEYAAGAFSCALPTQNKTQIIIGASRIGSNSLPQADWRFYESNQTILGRNQANRKQTLKEASLQLYDNTFKKCSVFD